MTPHDLAEQIAKAAADTKALDIVILDLRKLTSFTDFFVICSGNSDRQVKAIADTIQHDLKDQGRKPLSREGEGRWVLVDYGDVVAHVFHREERSFYSIERLWRDAERVHIEGVTSEEVSGVEKEAACAHHS